MKRERIINRSLCFALTLLFLLLLLPGHSLAAGVLSSGSCGEHISWTLYDDGRLTVSGTGDMTDYEGASSSFTYSHRREITSIELSEGITHIGDYAFYDCTGVTRVTIPDSVTSIGYEGFFACNSLKSIDLGSGVSSIGEWAFAQCTSLESISLPDQVTQIGEHSFSSNSTLKELSIGSGLSTLPKSAFAYCENLTTAKLGNVTFLGENVFSGDYNLKTVYYEGSLSQWNALGFGSTVNVHLKRDGGTSGDLRWVLFEDGLLWLTGNGSTEQFSGAANEPWYSWRENITAAEFGSGVTVIQSDTFFRCSSLTSIKIADTVTTIWGCAFEQCTALTELFIPISVTHFYCTAASGCSNLVSFAVDPDNPVYSVADGVLYSKNQTKLVVCPEGKQGAFVIPDSVNEIGMRAFQECRKLTSVKVPEGVTVLPDDAFFNCTNLDNIRLPSTLVTIGNSTFSNCSNLKSISLPVSLTAIEYSAFNSTGLSDVCYEGTQEQWNDIAIDSGNGTLENATKHFGHAYGAPSWTWAQDHSSAEATFICTACGDEKTVVDNVIDSLTVDATCSAVGYTDYTAEVEFGGQTFSKTVHIEIEKLAHSPGAPTEENRKGPTCTEAGSYEQVVCCTVCGEEISRETVTIPAAGHRYGAPFWTWPSNEEAMASFKCEVCNHRETLYDDEVDVSTQGASCSAAGETVYTAKVTLEGEPYTNEKRVTLEKLPHTPGAPTEENRTGPTCTEAGSYEQVVCCTVCGEEISRETVTIPILDHDYEAVVTEPTCTQQGYTTYTCSRCGNNYKDDYTPAAGHDYGGPVWSWADDLLSASAVFTCTLCDDRQIVTANVDVSPVAGYFDDCAMGAEYYHTASVTFDGSSYSDELVVYHEGGEHDYDFDSAVWDWASDYDSATVTVPCHVCMYEAVVNASVTETAGATNTELIHTATAVLAGRTLQNVASESLTSGSCGVQGANVIWTLDGSGVLTISGTGKMQDFDSNGAPWQGDEVYTVRIGSGVTSIGNYAFSGCHNLSSVTIPNSVTSIGNSAFSGCHNLSSVTIPNSVTSIGDYAFSSCHNLNSVTIPNRVTSISNYAFSYCSRLTSITIPNSVTSIGNSAFSGCSSLTSVTIPDSLTSIGSSAFENCYALTSVTIPSSVTSIGSYAFNYCSGLTSVTIPDSVTSISDSVFSYCTALASVTIPDSVTSIGSSAFSSCSSLTSVTIPDSVTSIGSSAFSSCSSLTSVTIPDSITKIGDSAFSYCSGLTSVTIPDSVTSIGSSAFSGCSRLAKLTIPNSVTNIGGYAFSGCSKLTKVTIPNSVTYISDGVFSSCSSLTSVTIPNSVTSIGYSAFSSSGLTSVTIPDSVTYISDGVFQNCSSLTNLVLPDRLSYVSANLCEGCAALTELTLPASATAIEAYAFSGCSGLTGLEIPGSVSSIGDYAFQDCGSLESIVLSSHITSLGARIFSGCSSLKSAVILCNVSTIGEYMFTNCAALESVVIPTSVTTVNTGAFRYCEALADVYYGDSEAKWNKIRIRGYNEPLSSATVHYGEVPLTVGGVRSSISDMYYADERIIVGYASVTWYCDALGTGALEYRFDVYLNGALLKEGSYGSANSFTYSPTNAGTYTVQVFVRDGNQTVSFTGCPVSAELAPGPYLTGSAEKGYIDLRWDTGMWEYALYRRENDGSGWGAWTRLAREEWINSWADYTVIGGRDYQYRVRAYVGGIAGNYSNVVSLTAVVVTPAAPSVTATAEAGKVTLKWGKLSGVTDYKVFRRAFVNGGWGEWETIGPLAATATNWTDTSVTTAAKYQYRMKSYADGKASAYSTTLTVTVPPEAPTLTAAAAAGKVTLNWDKVAGATQYRVYRRYHDGMYWSSWEQIAQTAGTNWTDTAVMVGVKYQYRLTACVDSAESAYSTSLTVTVPPEAPTLTAADMGNYITLNWSDVSGATEYRLYRRTYESDGWSAWTQITTVDMYSGSWDDWSVTPGMKYQYRMKAYAGSTASAYSAAREVTLPPLEAPALTVADMGNYVTLYWSDVSGATEYRIYRRTYESGGWGAWTQVVGLYSGSWDDWSVTPGMKYQYRMKAYAGSAASAYSAAREVTLPPLEAPPLTATDMGTYVTLNWSDVSGAMEYRIYRRAYESGGWGAWTQITTVGLYLGSWDDFDVTPGMTYQYRMKAYAGSAASAYSTAQSVTFAAYTPEAPMLTAWEMGGSVTLSWPDVSGATKYRIYRRTFTGGAWDSWAQVAQVTGMEWHDTAVSAGTQYQYRAKAYVNDVWSGYSNICSVLFTIPKPDAPGRPSYKLLNNNTNLLLFWNPVEGAQVYRIYRRVDGGEWEMMVSKTASTQWTDKNIQPGHKYTYRVRAGIQQSDGSWLWGDKSVNRNVEL